MILDSPTHVPLVADPEMMETSPLKILFEDTHLIVVFKPHRLLVQSNHSGHPTLFEKVCARLKEVYKTNENVYLGMVHRLDRAASGLLVFAKSCQAAASLSEQFRDRSVEKTYEALVQGVPATPSGSLIGYLAASSEGPSVVHNQAIAGAKLAEMEYRVLDSRNGISLIKVKLHTGRRHQIRAQLATIDCPILGDGNYGATQAFLAGSIALVAQELCFNHPVTNKRLEYILPRFLSSIRLTWK